jgi:hypothetical protein
MRYLGGHLGVAVSALLDGDLDVSSSERAWAHVHACDFCRRQVEREGWVKTRLATISGADAGAPSQQLLGSLYDLGTPSGPQPDPTGTASWAAVDEIERRGRVGRRAGLALAGAGSVSVAVLGLASLTGGSLAIGGSSPAPTSALTRAPVTGTPALVAPVASVHGRLPREATHPRTGSSGGEQGGLPR